MKKLWKEIKIKLLKINVSSVLTASSDGFVTPIEDFSDWNMND